MPSPYFDADECRSAIAYSVARSEQIRPDIAIVRRMSEADLPQLGAIEAEAYPPEVVEGNEVLASIFRCYPPGCFVAVLASRVLGYLLSFPTTRSECPCALGANHTTHDGDQSPDCYYIHDLAVKKTARGQRLGSRLVRCAHDLAKTIGYAGQSILLTAVNNSESHWQKHGYTALHTEALLASMQSRLMSNYPAGSLMMERRAAVITTANLQLGLCEGLPYDDTLTVMRMCYEDVDCAGFSTSGHQCEGRRDYEGSDLLYGEILPLGVCKALGDKHLDGKNASVCFELGMGTGKVALQAWLQLPNLRKVVGIELAPSRYDIAEASLLRLQRQFPSVLRIRSHSPGDELTVETDGGTCERVLSFRRGDMTQVPASELLEAEVVFMEVVLPHCIYASVTRMLIDKLRDGARMITYTDLRKFWVAKPDDNSNGEQLCPFHKVEANKSVDDRFDMSFGRGHGTHLHVYKRDNSRAPTIFGCANWVGKPFDVTAAAACSESTYGGAGSGRGELAEAELEQLEAQAQANEALAIYLGAD